MGHPSIGSFSLNAPFYILPIRPFTPSSLSPSPISYPYLLTSVTPVSLMASQVSQVSLVSESSLASSLQKNRDRCEGRKPLRHHRE